MLWWNKKKIGWALFAIITIMAAIFCYTYFGWVQFFGWTYSGAFALSALPQTMRSRREGHSRGVADGTLILWLLGEVAGLVYGFGLMQLPIIINCLINTIFVSIIVWYRLKPRK